jgi:hypothetical protein
MGGGMCHSFNQVELDQVSLKKGAFWYLNVISESILECLWFYVTLFDIINQIQLNISA